jgi:hypothetical protein
VSTRRLVGDDGPEGYGTIEVTVADTDIGISSENLLDVFEKIQTGG